MGFIVSQSIETFEGEHLDSFYVRIEHYQLNKLTGVLTKCKPVNTLINGYLFVNFNNKSPKLLELCLAVKLNPEQAGTLLPTGSGFFFGGEEYDEWYFNDIDNTIEVLKEALSDDDASYYYSSSW